MRIKKPKFWDNKKKTFISYLLLPLSFLYQVFFWINKILNNFRNNKKLKIPVICVGNIYLGGTGKTPLVREIHSIVKSFGKNPAFIKKHYDYLSDEIKMLEKTGKIYTNHNRSSGIFLSAADNYDVAILDDGFQDFTISPNLSILCFNSKQMIGNGQVIPSGPLRESLSAIQRADCIIINGDKNSDFEEKISKFKKNKKLHIFYSKYKIKNIEKFKNKKITAFAGIGNPTNFFDLRGVAYAGFTLNAASGFLLFSSQASILISNIPFLLKISFLSIAMILAIFIHKQIDNGDNMTLSKISAFISLTCWLGAIVAGRLIAYIF